MKGRNIVAIRRKFGLSQAAFARVLGVSPVVLCRWEHDTVSPSSRNARRLAEYRQLSRAEVLFRLKEQEQALYQ